MTDEAATISDVWLKVAIAVIGALAVFVAMHWDNVITAILDHEHRITKLEAKDEP